MSDLSMFNWSPADAINTPYGLNDGSITADYLKMVNDRSLFFFHQLSDEAKEKAIINVLEHEIYTKEKLLDITRNQIKSDINYCINDYYFLSRVRNSLAAFNKIKVNKNHYITSYIEQNFCIFDVDGNYFDPYTYEKKN